MEEQHSPKNKKSTLRRRNGMKLQHTKSGTLHSKTANRKMSMPIVRPPLPPKSDSLKEKAAHCKKFWTSDSPVSNENNAERKFANFQSSAFKAQKVVVTKRSASVQSVNNEFVGKHFKNVGASKEINLIERRKRFFHQLSQPEAMLVEVVGENVHTKSPQQNIEKRASWTSYVDIDEPSEDINNNDNNYAEVISSFNSSNSSSLDSLKLPAEKIEVHDTLATVNENLTQAEALLSNLAIRDRDEEVSGENEEELENLIRRHERISQALESLRNSQLPTPEKANHQDNSFPQREDCVDVGRDLRIPLDQLKTSRSFNLFREKSPLPPPEPERIKSAINSPNGDGGYLSDTDSSSFSLRTRVRYFISDSFGKGPTKTNKNMKKRLVIETPFRAPENNEAEHESNNQTFFVDKNVSESLTIPKSKDEEAKDTKLFENNLNSDEDNIKYKSEESLGNRSSIVSGSSSSSTEINSINLIYDSNENDIDNLDPEARQARKVFNIAKEMKTSEEDYVKSLKLVNVDFRSFMECAIKEANGFVIPEKDFQRIFNFLSEIQLLNEELLKDFTARVENWENEKKVADIIVKKGDFLKIYTCYVQQFTDLNNHFNECTNNYPVFHQKVLEFEKREKCRNLKVHHFLLKPVQRLPQYKLLLENYLKNLSPDSEDYENALQALSIVTKAADHANDKMKHDDNFKKLLNLQTRLGEDDLVQANRELIKHGEIQKISRSGINQRYLILCSDILIYAKYSGAIVAHDSNLKTSYRIPLTNLKVNMPSNPEEYPMDFDIISPVRSCTMRASNPADRDDWVNLLKRSIEEHLQRRATFSKAASIDKVAVLGETAPIWVPDERVTMCQTCHCDFNFRVRRHHCRACGKVVCHSCSANRAPLKYQSYSAARVCDECFDQLLKLKENDTRLKSLKNRFTRDLNSKPNTAKTIPKRLQVKANDEGCQISGYLHKQNVKTGKFKKMWFVLKDRVVYVYKAPADTLASETIPVLGFNLDIENEIPQDLQPSCQNGKGFSLTHVGSEPLIFFAESQLTAEKWTAALLESVCF